MNISLSRFLIQLIDLCSLKILHTKLEIMELSEKTISNVRKEFLIIKGSIDTNIYFLKTVVYAFLFWMIVKNNSIVLVIKLTS
jgi:hypothetical protein